MTQPSAPLPDNAKPNEADVVVIGGGSGGATFAYACARAGKSVLVLERGVRFPNRKQALDEQAMLIDKVAYDDRPIDLGGSPKRLFMGGVLGGGSALYGAALLRPSPDDFHPGRHYADRLPKAIWDWPIDYDRLESYYTKAEYLFGVAGDHEENYPAIGQPSDGYPAEPLTVHPINQRMMTACRDAGLHPFRLPLAIDPDKCKRCHACAGYICPTGARRSSAQILDEAQAQSGSLDIRTGVEVIRLRFDGNKATAAEVRDRRTGDTQHIRAKRYALAAGAIGSPIILKRSGFEHPLVGRNYMMHLSPIVTGIFPKRTGADETFVKQVGFTDFYFGTKELPHKMGLVQSLPVPGPLLMAKMAPRFLPRPAQDFLRRRMLPLVGIIEDLPRPENRVTLTAAGRPKLEQSFSDFDKARGQALSKEMARILKKTGAWLTLSKGFPSDEHVAHQCGTLRFGTDPSHAVLDPDCRFFDAENVFAVDGSFFPTSLGVGPALTIIANALRVADIVAREL